MDGDHFVIISRAEAKARGLTRYFTGKPCKHGHIAERRVEGGCIECIRERERLPDAMERRRIRKRRSYDPELAGAQRLADLENRRKIARESARRRRAAEPQIRIRDRENARRWVEEHPEKRRSYLQENADKIKKRLRDNAKRRRRENPDGERARVNRWRALNPERTSDSNRIHLQKRRAQKAAAPNTFTLAEWLVLSARSSHCHWCRRLFTATRRRTHDHVIPLVAGGANTLENSVCACRECNCRKQAQLFNPVTGQGILL